MMTLMLRDYAAAFMPPLLADAIRCCFAAMR